MAVAEVLACSPLSWLALFISCVRPLWTKPNKQFRDAPKLTCLCCGLEHLWSHADVKGSADGSPGKAHIHLPGKHRESVCLSQLTHHPTYPAWPHKVSTEEAVFMEFRMRKYNYFFIICCGIFVNYGKMYCICLIMERSLYLGASCWPKEKASYNNTPIWL